MPFDPTQPANSSTLDAEIVRDQLNALNDAIAAIPAGPAGPQGVPGEITFQDLVTDRINHARNPTSVSALGLAVSDPPTQAELQAVVAKVDELLMALRREP